MSDKDLWWRALVLLLLSIWCWSMLASVRTWGFGAPWSGVLRMSLYFYAFSATVTFFVLWGYRLGQILLTALAMTVICVGGADAFGRAQERNLVRQHGEHPDHYFTVKRWPPFEHHSIGYIEGVGWWGCD